MSGLMAARYRTETWYRILIIWCHYTCLSAGVRSCSVCSRLAFALIWSGYLVTSVMSPPSLWVSTHTAVPCCSFIPLLHHSFKITNSQKRCPLWEADTLSSAFGLCFIKNMHREARFSLVFWWSFLQCSRLFNSPTGLN